MRGGEAERRWMGTTATSFLATVPAGTVHGFRIESEIARYLILTSPRHGE